MGFPGQGSQYQGMGHYLFIFQYSVCTWLESLSIHAHAIMGHSLGEIAAAGMSLSCVTGSFAHSIN